VLALQLAKGAARLARSGRDGGAEVFAPLRQLVLEHATLAAPASQG